MKDKKGFVLFLLLSLIIWQLCVSLTKILNMEGFMLNNDIISTMPTTNNGAAFGILNNSSHVLGIFGIVVVVALFTWAYKNIKTEDKGKILALSAFSAGIIGNTFERLINGFVFDFIKINLFDFPVFNLFDVLISVSVFCFVLLVIKHEFLKRKKS